LQSKPRSSQSADLNFGILFLNRTWRFTQKSKVSQVEFCFKTIKNRAKKSVDACMGQQTRQQKDFIGHFGLIVTIAGIVGYILLNSGLFDKAAPPPKHLASSVDAQAQSELAKKWKEELVAIDLESGEKQKELEDLTSRLARIRLQVQEREIALDQAERSSKNNRVRTSDPITTVFRSISQLRNYLSQDSGADPFIFEADSGVRVPSGAQIVSMVRPFAEESVFLRRSGLRWASAVTKAAVDLKARSLLIRYVDGEFERKRSQVLKRYIQEQMSIISDSEPAGGSPSFVNIEMQAVESGQIMSASDVDLFIQTSKTYGRESAETAQQGEQQE
jgi:hypothetical protein